MTKYEEIQNDIIDKIQCGVYKADDRIPSEKEIMDKWKVSRITATKALTELSLGGYIYRIQGKGSFVLKLGSHIPPHSVRAIEGRPSPDARAVKKIGVALPSIGDTHSVQLMSGITKVLRFPEYHVMTVMCRTNDAEDYALNTFLEENCEGIILFPSDFEMYSDTILKMSLGKYPLVLVDRKFPGMPAVSVTGDSYAGCEAAIEHLYSLGHRKIAYMSMQSYREQVTKMRFDGYRESMLKRGLEVIDCGSIKKSDSGKAELLRHLKQKDITAVLTCNLSALRYLCTVCETEGISVPNDLSVITFDNPNYLGSHLWSTFTYVDQCSYDMGFAAANALKQIIENTDAPENKIIQPKLVINKSTKKL